MKVSEFLKKIGHISGAEIRIEFKVDKADAEPDVESLTGDTPEEAADQIIKRAAEYTLQEANFDGNIVMIMGIRAAKRTPKPKLENPLQEAANRLKKESKENAQNIRDELERLDRAVAVLIETIVAPFHRIGQRENGKCGGILVALKNAWAAVHRILTRLFGKGE